MHWRRHFSLGCRWES